MADSEQTVDKTASQSVSINALWTNILKLNLE